jgi:hypothetical protein
MTETFVHQALVVGRAVDVHGRVVGGLTVACDRANTAVRVASGGEFVVAGDAARVFPNLANAPDSVRVVLSAPARADHPLDVTIGQGASLPVDVGNVALPAVPVSLAGRVRRRDLSLAPVADALVGYVPDTAVPGLFPLALRTPLASPHPATSEVRAATVAPTAAPTTCPAGARAGERLLVPAATAGIGATTVLRFTPGIREHYAVVAEVVAGYVVLQAPLTASVPPGGEVGAVSATPNGPTRTLARDAMAGDGLLTLDGDVVGDAVRIVDANTSAIEVYASGARTDAAGFYRLAGIRGVPAVAVKATVTGLAGTQDPTVWRVDERADPNLLELTVQP